MNKHTGLRALQEHSTSGLSGVQSGIRKMKENHIHSFDKHLLRPQSVPGTVPSSAHSIKERGKNTREQRVLNLRKHFVNLWKTSISAWKRQNQAKRAMVKSSGVAFP